MKTQFKLKYTLVSIVFIVNLMMPHSVEALVYGYQYASLKDAEGNVLNYKISGGHNRMIMDVVDIMKKVELGGIDTQNPNVNTNSHWSQYISALSNAKGKLSKLRCDLPAPYTQTEVERVCFNSLEKEQQLADLAAQPRIGKIEHSYDYYNEASKQQESCYDAYIDPSSYCDYNPKDNMSYFGRKKIDDVRYYHFERNVQTGYCFMTKLPVLENEEVPPSISYELLGHILGWHAGKVDDQPDETWLWYKPSNGKAGSVLTEILNQSTTGPFTIIIVAIKCFINKIRGESCDFPEDMKRASDLSPTGQLDGLMPGVGSHTNKLYTGLWHMMNVDRKGKGVYNDLPGTMIVRSGPGGKTGALDFVIMLIGDLGLSLDANSSKGDDRYGQYDEIVRSWVDWQVDTIGILEFSPLYNLGRFGWEEFWKDRTRAKYLGWPLHALGDTIVPHHLVASIGLGHDPFEVAVQDKWGHIVHVGVPQDILTNGYYWWEKYCHGKSNVDVSSMIIEVAEANRALVTGTWAWDDDASSDYFLTKDKAEKAAIVYNTYSRHDEFPDHVRPLAVNAMGAALALLGCAADYVQPAGVDENTLCPDGQRYCASHKCGFECLPDDGSTDEPTEIDIKSATEPLDINPVPII